MIRSTEEFQKLKNVDYKEFMELINKEKIAKKLIELEIAQDFNTWLYGLADKTFKHLEHAFHSYDKYITEKIIDFITVSGDGIFGFDQERHCIHCFRLSDCHCEEGARPFDWNY